MLVKITYFIYEKNNFIFNTDIVKTNSYKHDNQEY